MERTFGLLAAGAAVMIAVPLLLGRLIARRWRAPWRLYAIGAATFVGSQIGHIPFNLAAVPLVQERAAGWGAAGPIAVAIFVGLSAGVFEEGARYLTMRYWATDVRGWRNGLMLGAGHGGAEAIILGLLVAINAAVLYGIASGRLALDLPPEVQAAVDSQIQALGRQPWYLLVLGAVERLFALVMHLALSLLVLQSLVRGRIRWLAAAVGWHAAVNAVGVTALAAWGPLVTEGLIGLMALASLAIILALIRAEPAPKAAEPAEAVVPLALSRRESTAEQVEASKYM